MFKQSEFGVVSRRSFTRTLLASPAVPAVVSAMRYTPAQQKTRQTCDCDELFAELEEKIRSGMEEFAIPGAAVGVIYKGKEFVQTYGVKDIRHPTQKVDENTAFRIGSISKPVTGTAAMRLVESGSLDLEAPVTTYIEDFQAPEAAEGVTVRQLLNHSAGWLGDDFHDTGAGDDALAKFVNDIHRLPQLTPVGSTFFYNNSAICVAGRLIEVITGNTFESSVQRLVLDPLGMSRSSYFQDELGTNVAVPHALKANTAIAMPEWFYVARDINSSGGLFSSVTDLLSFARFYLGNGRAANGERVMSEVALRSMWSQLGPGGTLTGELKGMGVTWQVRPTIEGVAVVEHGGDLPGFRQGLFMVPEKQFALMLLTNSEGGVPLKTQLFVDDWVLRSFAGVHNPPASPQSLSASELAQYEGEYVARMINEENAIEETRLQLSGRDGGLDLTFPPQPVTVYTLRFYSYDYVVYSDGRADFLRDVNGSIKWFRFAGRLYERIG